MPIGFNNTNVNTISFNGSNIARATFNGEQFFLNIPPTTKACEYKEEYAAGWKEFIYVDGVKINPPIDTAVPKNGTAYIDSSGNISLTSGANKRAFTFSMAIEHTFVSREQKTGYHIDTYKNTLTLELSGITRTFTKNVQIDSRNMGGNDYSVGNQSWSQLI